MSQPPSPSPPPALPSQPSGLSNPGANNTSDKRKQSLYFPERMLRDIQAEAVRQDRSLSWIVQQAWKIAQPTIARYPAIDDLERDDEEE